MTRRRKQWPLAGCGIPLCVAFGLSLGAGCKEQTRPVDHTSLQLAEKASAASVNTVAGTNATAHAIEARAASNFDLKPFIALSPDVLVGTDMASLAELATTIGSVPQGGVFVSEMGGAGLKISVRRQGDVLHVARTFSEPGREAFTKSYRLHVASDEHSAAQGGAQLLALRDGLLLLEKAPEVEGIPEGMWLLYSPERAGE